MSEFNDGVQAFLNGKLKSRDTTRSANWLAGWDSAQEEWLEDCQRATEVAEVEKLQKQEDNERWAKENL
jgi:hypothetical protein